MRILKSGHFAEMLIEREIKESWIDIALNAPEKVEKYPDGTKHYIRKIEEYGNRYLRVIINDHHRPPKGVTAFFDRRIIKKI